MSGKILVGFVAVACLFVNCRCLPAKEGIKTQEAPPLPKDAPVKPPLPVYHWGADGMSPQLPVEPDHKIAVKINAPDDVMREFSLFSTTRMPLPQHDEPAPPPPPKKRVGSKPVLPVEIDEPFEGLPSTPSPVIIVPKTTRIPGVGGVYKTTCEYKGEDYKQGASWQDGCSYVCVCVNGIRNWMRCMDRCPRFNLGPLCTLVTKPNTCCPEVKCGNN